MTTRTLPAGFSVRPPTTADAQAVLALWACGVRQFDEYHKRLG